MINNESQPLLSSRNNSKSTDDSFSGEQPVTCAQDIILGCGMGAGGVAGASGGFMLGQAAGSNVTAGLGAIICSGAGAAIGGIVGIGLYGLSFFCYSQCITDEEKSQLNINRSRAHDI